MSKTHKEDGIKVDADRTVKLTSKDISQADLRAALASVKWLGPRRLCSIPTTSSSAHAATFPWGWSIIAPILSQSGHIVGQYLGFLWLTRTLCAK